MWDDKLSIQTIIIKKHKKIPTNIDHNARLTLNYILWRKLAFFYCYKEIGTCVVIDGHDTDNVTRDTPLLPPHTTQHNKNITPNRMYLDVVIFNPVVDF